MKRSILLCLALLWACTPPAEPTRPFIEVTLVNPDGFVAPEVDTLEIFSEGLVEGQQLSSTSTADVSGNPLPTDFVLLFSERARGASVDIRVRGLLAGVDIFTATATATAGTSQVTAIVRFCGDNEISADRQEQCDDANQDDTDDCLNSCQSAACGDGFVLDGVEECDDGNIESDDGCDSQCKREFVTQISSGGTYTCALLINGRVRCWGTNLDGQLGYGNTENIGDDEFPKDAGSVDVGSPVVQITTGSSHACVLLENGTVKCWGRNGFGQLGYGDVESIGDDELPSDVGVVNVGGIVTQISAGTNHTCAVLSGGGLRCWGDNQFGQLGYGNEENIGDNKLPIIAGDISVGAGVLQVSAGQRHTCALLVGGSVKCWGLGVGGRLGYGNQNTIGDNEFPSSVGIVSVGGQAENIFSGSLNSCVLLDGGIARCWGDGSQGVLGFGNTNDIGDDEVPTNVIPVDLNETISQISLGDLHICAVSDSGSVFCWGSGSNGKLGYENVENIGDDESPLSIGNVDVGVNAQAVSAGGASICILSIDGFVKCWGFNGDGCLGYRNTDNIGDDETPASVDFVPIF